MAEDGRLFFKKGKVVELRKNMPTAVGQSKEEVTLYSDAFVLALAHDQTEIVKMLMDYGLVDLGPKSDALYMAIRRKDFALMDDMLDHGGQFGRKEQDITRLLLNLSDVWGGRIVRRCWSGWVCRSGSWAGTPSATPPVR